MFVVVHTHSGLTQGKSGEYTHCVERDKGVDQTAESHKQSNRCDAQKNHAIRKDQAIAAMVSPFSKAMVSTRRPAI